MNAAQQEGQERQRVLIVDDNQEAAEMLQFLLDMHGYQVEVAHDGASGLELNARFAPQVICSDLNMPGMSGYEFARAIRAGGAHGQLLIAVSGVEAGGREAVHAAGFDTSLTKPFSLDEILGPIQAYFAQRR